MGESTAGAGFVVARFVRYAVPGRVPTIRSGSIREKAAAPTRAITGQSRIVAFHGSALFPLFGL